MVPLTVTPEPGSLLGFRCTTDAAHASLATWLERDLGRGGAELEIKLFAAIAQVSAGQPRVVLSGDEHSIQLEAGVAVICRHRGGPAPLRLPFQALEDAVVRWFEVVDPAIASQLAALRSTPKAAAGEGDPFRAAMDACREATRAHHTGDREGARASLESAWRLAHRVPGEASPLAAEVFQRLAARWRDLGDAERAFVAAQRALALERSANSPSRLGNAALFAAELEAERGAWDDAARHASEGAQCFRAAFGAEHAEARIAQQRADDYGLRARGPGLPGPGRRVAGYELLRRLGGTGRYIESWTARLAGGSGAALVVRILGLRTFGEWGDVAVLDHELDALIPAAERAASIRGRGLLPGRLVRGGERLLFERPFLPARLVDRLPPTPTAPPSAELLAAIEDLATGLDLLWSASGSLPFVAPGNLLWTGHSAALVDYGLEPIVERIESSYDGPRLIDGPATLLERSIDLQPLQGTSGLERIRTPALVLACAYVALRTGRGVLVPEGTPRLEQLLAAAVTGRAFLKTGRVPLDALPHAGEREVLHGALALPHAQRFRTAEELAAALRLCRGA